MSASTSTPTSSASPPFFGLPYELIKIIFTHCDDYHTLDALRRTCKAFKETIDHDPVFDKLLFRNRPFTNPTLSPAELCTIRTLAQTEGDRADCDRDLSLETGNPYIQVHPALTQLFWDKSSPEVKYSPTSRLSVNDVPRLREECATCPPVYTIKLSLPNRTWVRLPRPELQRQQPVLVGDIIDVFVQLFTTSSEQWARQIQGNTNCVIPVVRFLRPSFMIDTEGLLRLCYCSYITDKAT